MYTQISATHLNFNQPWIFYLLQIYFPVEQVFFKATKPSRWWRFLHLVQPQSQPHPLSFTLFHDPRCALFVSIEAYRTATLSALSGSPGYIAPSHSTLWWCLSLLSGIPPFRLGQPEPETETESNGTPRQEVAADAILFDYFTVSTCSRGRRKTAMCATVLTSCSSSVSLVLVDGVWLCKLCQWFCGCTGATSFTCQVSGSYEKLQFLEWVFT